MLGGDRLLGDVVGGPASPGITLVAWHASTLYVDRFNGTSWDTLATNGEANVTNPYNYYMSAPTVGATMRWDGQAYKYYFAWQAIPSGDTDKHILAARLP